VIEVETLARELATIAPETLKAAEDLDVFDSVPNFRLFFESLQLLVSDNVQPEVIVSYATNSSLANPEPLSAMSSSIPLKRRPDSLTIATSTPIKVSLTSSRMEQDIPQTPDQPTIPKDSTYSGDSIESINEDNTKQMISTLIRTTISLLGTDFRLISWPLHAQKCRLGVSGY
jgi:hypothetical protein